MAKEKLSSTQKLSPAVIDKAKPGETIHDTTVTGLHVRVSPTRKSFFYFYRTKEGVQRRPKIGDYGIITLNQAREDAKAIRNQVERRQDPMEERQKRKEAPTVVELAVRFWERHAVKNKAAKDTYRHLALHILPALGAKRAKPRDERPKTLDGMLADLKTFKGGKRAIDVVYDDVERLHDRVAKKAPVQANRVVATLSKMMRLAETWKIRPQHSNPCRGITRSPEQVRRRHMAGDEPPKIAAELRRFEELAPASVAFLWLLILSGARKGEIAAAKWDWLEGSILHLPDSKTGQRDIFLPPQVMALLEKLPRTSGTITGIKSPDKIWQQVRKAAGCPDLRLHDLRRSFASAALSAGVSLAQVGELLGHRNTQTTKGYSYLQNDAAHAAAKIAADRITELMKAKESGE